MSQFGNKADTMCVFIHNNTDDKIRGRKRDKAYGTKTACRQVKISNGQTKEVRVRSNDRQGAKMESRAYKDNLPMA